MKKTFAVALFLSLVQRRYSHVASVPPPTYTFVLLFSNMTSELTSKLSLILFSKFYPHRGRKNLISNFSSKLYQSKNVTPLHRIC